MTNVLQTEDIKSNFWEGNPSIALPRAFKRLIELDKTKDKRNSSSIMWAIYLLLHANSPFINMNIKDRKKLIAEEYLKDEAFLWEDDPDIKEAMQEFTNLLITPARRLAYEWQEKLEERSNFIAKTKYNAETADTLDKMMAATKKIYDMYYQVLADLEKEEAQSHIEGDAEESLTEKGQI